MFDDRSELPSRAEEQIFRLSITFGVTVERGYLVYHSLTSRKTIRMFYKRHYTISLSSRRRNYGNGALDLL